jgi:hypothetical protein
MAVFVCASDETYDDNPGNFLYSGWAGCGAPVLEDG